MARAASTTVKVEASAFLRIVRYAARRPSTRTMFVCSANPSRTFATSPIVTTAPFTTLMGMLLKPLTVAGLEFIATLYSRSPIRAVPAGIKTLEDCSAVTTSSADNPFPVSALGSTSTVISRVFPP